MVLSTNSLSIVYSFSWEYISISSLISWFVLYLILQTFTNQNATMRQIGLRPRGVVANALVCSIAVSKFELQSCYYVHFRTNSYLGINLLIDSAIFLLLATSLYI